MDGTIINKFYADVDNLGLRFPVAEISNKKNFVEQKIFPYMHWIARNFFISSWICLSPVFPYGGFFKFENSVYA